LDEHQTCPQKKSKVLPIRFALPIAIGERPVDKEMKQVAAKRIAKEKDQN